MSFGHSNVVSFCSFLEALVVEDAGFLVVDDFLVADVLLLPFEGFFVLLVVFKVEPRGPVSLIPVNSVSSENERFSEIFEGESGKLI